MIKSIMKSLRNMRPMSDIEYAEWYLNQSTNVIDLENRMRDLERKGIMQYR